MDKKTQSTVGALEGHIEAIHTVKCHFCGDELVSNGSSLLQSAAYFYGKGWREISSKKYQVIAAACPACAKAKDRDR